MSTVNASYTSNIAKLTALVYLLDSIDALCEEEDTPRVVLRRCLGYPVYEHCTNFTSTVIPRLTKIIRSGITSVSRNLR